MTEADKPSERRIDCGDVPPMVRADFRLPADLKARAQAEAERQGLDFAEYVRQSLVREIAWQDALEAVRKGADPEALADNERLLARLRELGER